MPIHPGEFPFPTMLSRSKKSYIGCLTLLSQPVAGWVATEMGSIAGSGGMPVEKSAAGIVEVIGGLDPTKSAHFVNFANEELPW